MKTRADIAHEEITKSPIFLLQKRWVYPNQECLADYDDEGDPIDPDTKEKIDDDELLKKGWGVAIWHVVTVFATRDEAECWGEKTKYRYGKGRKNIDWQVYCIPCAGELVKILEEYYKKGEDRRT